MKTIVGFLSRPHGFEVLSTITSSPKYKLLQVYTHMLNPKSQDPNRSTRTDYDLYVKKCSDNDIKLVTIDSKNQPIVDMPECDYIIEVSWRYLIPIDIIKKARIAAFGVHRGKLPEYAGAEPIKRALLKRDQEIFLTAHFLDQQIDRGSVITTISHPVNYDNRYDLKQNTQRLREEITPLFSKIVFVTLEILGSNHH